MELSPQEKELRDRFLQVMLEAVQAALEPEMTLRTQHNVRRMVSEMLRTGLPEGMTLHALIQGTETLKKELGARRG
jgi:hypothetical protein